MESSNPCDDSLSECLFPLEVSLFPLRISICFIYMIPGTCLKIDQLVVGCQGK